MANIKTQVDAWEVTDLADNSTITVSVFSNTEMGNRSRPGIQIICQGKIANYEPLSAERWAYQAAQEKKNEHLVEEASWTEYEDTYIRQWLVLGEKPKAKIEVKVRSKQKPVVKEYDLPFTLD
ncbi:hypothetical protein Q4E93_31610 [Flavitalea sp. BT771]|uniref:hypothetical protein n=1 Tax=Flavitalea sp. BT771 TaxID=3063329 RepID=UPI0026E3A047|nr:hypothetical protein [Flavitalea sp. BT771]MDO6435206.1 hypothetical protein [Flavitalea sp. BT771]MDV6224089.1 hypothetical protein [Flavitalea sp. BT771]